MAIKKQSHKHGDFVLSIFALLVVGGLCLKGAQSLSLEIPQQNMCIADNVFISFD